MFGDNLSFISDTTIAACNGQGCAMKDKFREKFLDCTSGSGCDITSDFNSVFPDGHFRIRDRELSSASDRAVYSGTGGWHHRCQCVCRVTDRNCVRCDHYAGGGPYQSGRSVGKCRNGASGMFETSMVAILVAALCALTGNMAD